jgi:alpha-methylacyl-CoA racemase
MGPLAGVTVIELAGLGPGPFCAMLLADMGAEVICIGRPGMAARPHDLLNRNKKSLIVDLKRPRGRELALSLIERAQILLEGFRPGVTERLGLGPADCQGVNPRLVYGRMTGWGQSGPLAGAAGHDLNYIALTGALHAIGRRGQPPTPPLNLVGDFGGGALYLAFGLICALREAERSGQGQVVDAAMVDGAAALMTAIYGYHAAGRWNDRRGDNYLDSGAPFYDVYETKDGKHVALAAIEPQFFAELLARLGLPAELAKSQNDREQWPALRTAIAKKIAAMSRAECCALMEGTDACFAPVLSMGEAPSHPHNLARGNFLEVDGVTQPGPAPRFSRTPAGPVSPPPRPGEHTDALLARHGLDAAAIARLRADGIVA